MAARERQARQVERQRALEVLGLGARASSCEIEEAYAAKSRVLKRRIVAAGSITERNQHRLLLSDLVRIRDCALGPTEARKRAERARRRRTDSTGAQDWWHPELGVPEGVRERKAALEFFGLSPYSPPEEIRAVFFRRSRALKHHVAHAENDQTLAEYRRALRRLNQLLDLALQPPTTTSTPLTTPVTSDPDDETLTDFVEFGARFDPGALVHETPEPIESSVDDTTDASDLIPGADPETESSPPRGAPPKRNATLSDSVFDDLDIEPPEEGATDAARP